MIHGCPTQSLVVLLIAGVSLMNKVVIEFPKVFWGDTTSLIGETAECLQPLLSRD